MGPKARDALIALEGAANQALTLEQNNQARMVQKEAGQEGLDSKRLQTYFDGMCAFCAGVCCHLLSRLVRCGAWPARVS